MTRLALLVVVVVVAGSGCTTKPSEEDCRKAITNMQVLMGTENLRDTEMVESQVRRCKGGSKKKAVDCAIKAQSLDDLRKCEFFKVPEGAKGVGGSDPSGSGATPPAGSGAAGSAAGSDATGSAAPAGSAAGSAAPTGSASGSAQPTGSAASPGGAAGSAATSAGSAVGSAK